MDNRDITTLDSNLESCCKLFKQLPRNYQIECLEQLRVILEPRIYVKSNIITQITEED